MPTVEDARIAWLAYPKNIEPMTVQTHDINLRLHVGPLRDMRLDTITRADIKEQMARVAAEKSMSKALQVRSALSAIYEWAIDHRLLDENIASSVKPPRIHQTRSGKDAEPDGEDIVIAELVPNDEQAVQFVEAFDSRWRAVPLTIATIGLRSGETQALDVPHWSNPVLDIVQSYSTVSSKYLNGHSRMKGPKSKAGRRRLTAPPQLAEALDETVGDRQDGPLFVGPLDGRLSMNNLRVRQWKDAQRDCGMDFILPHRLRHYCASRLIMAGKELSAVSELLGHSSTAVTARVYVHYLHKSNRIPDLIAHDVI